MQERASAVTLKGKAFTLVGPEIKVGQKAPEFTALAGDLSPVPFSASKGKTRLIVSVPSLDTPVCDMETRRFNEEAAKLGEQVQTFVISMDLPFAQNRFCSTAGIKSLKTLSDYRDASFGQAFGTLIKELRLLSRAIFVVGPDDVVQYVEYVPEVGSHPNYEAALGVLKQAAKA